MEAIFKKLEAIKIRATDLLQADDKEFCEQIFSLYAHHKIFIEKILLTTTEAYKNHVHAYPISTEDFYYDMDRMERQMKTFEEIISSLSETVIRKIENHFKEKYNLAFDTCPKSKKSDEAPTLDGIIDNMMNQSGTDLIQAGRDQIIGRFQQGFRIASRQPHIKNNKISFPNFFYLLSSLLINEASLDHSDKEVERLLDAIALFVFDSLEQPAIFKKHLQDWKQKIDFTISYELQPNLYLRFFKNRRIDISFPSTDEAEKFWQDFRLENIVVMNNSNN